MNPLAESDLRCTTELGRRPDSSPTWLGIMLLVAAYLAAALAANLLAAPSSHASPIWPAAGLAVAALLICGHRCWPGIWLGSFLFNVWLHGSGTGAVLAGLLAFGAVLQALLGARLTRHLFEESVPLAREGRVWRFLALAGPVACLVSATIGVTALYGAGRLEATQGLTHWLTWWAGDTLGVLLVAPIVLLFWTRLQPFRVLGGSRVALPLVVTGALLLVGHVALNRLEEAEAQRAESHLMEDTYEVGLGPLSAHVDALRGVGRFLAAGGEVTRQQFRWFTGEILERPGLLAVQWLPRITDTMRDEFELAVRRAGWGDYQIAERLHDGRLVRAGDRAEYFPTHYVEPLVGNESTVGFDYGSGPIRRAALERAARTGAATAAEPVQLLQTARPGLLVFVPVYRPEFDARTASSAARWAALQGLVLGALDLEQLIAPLASAAQAQQWGLRLTDLSPGNPERILIDTLPAGASPDWHRNLEFAGHILRLDMHAQGATWTPGASLQARSYLGFSVLAAFLVGLAALGAAGRNAASEVKVATRTAELERELRSRHAAEAALHASEQDLQITLHSIGDAVLATDAQRRVTRMNPIAEELTGWPLVEARGRPVDRVFRIVNELTRQPAVIPVDEVLRTGRIQELANHTALIARDGSERAIADSAAPIRGPQGDLRGVVLVFRDVSHERAAEHALRASEARYREFIEIAPYGVFVQCEGRLVFMNPRAIAILGGHSEADFLGRSVLDFLHSDSPEVVRNRIAGLSEAGIPALTLEEKWRRLDGSVFHGEATAVPYVHEGQSASLVLMRDISARKTAEEGLARARADAEEANRAKSAFLATMSHEIRTPMNGVIGMAEVLARSQLSTHQADLVRTIRDSGFALLRIIDDILDFSKIEAGKLEIEHSPLSVTHLVEGFCDSLVPVAARYEVEMALFIDPRIPERLLSDDVRLRQVLYNLVGNAIKFSAGREQRRGRVAVRVERVESHPLRVRFTVRDNGIGMSGEMVRSLFVPFSQGEVSTTRRFGGTGLGLAICKRLVDLLGGEIAVSSTAGVGSTFTVTLPFEAAAEQPARTLPDLSGLECIVICGPEISADDLRAYLEHAGARVRLADDGAAALHAATGLDAPVLIRDLGHQRLSANTPVGGAASTPHARQVLITRGARREPRVAGPNVVLLDGNVLRRHALLRAVAVAAGRASPEVFHDSAGKGLAVDGPAPPTVAEARARGELILVAEDDAINQKVILQQLALLGYAADVAGNGAEALDMWRSGHYAVLFTDLHMPEMDGYTLAAAIRAEEQGRHTPILALTANALRGEANRARYAGVDDFLTKPVQLQVLSAALTKWLPGTTGGKPAQDGESPQGPGADVSTSVDVSVLRALVGDNEETIREFLGDFLHSARSLAVKLRAAVAAGDARHVAAINHRLKASARTVGAQALGDLCAELENAGRAENRPAIARGLEPFETELAAVEAVIEGLLNGNVR